MRHQLSFGWSGEFVLMMTDTMKRTFGLNVIEPGLAMLRRPGEGGLKQCRESGRRTAERVKRRGTGSRAQQGISQRRGFPSLGQLG